MSTVPLTPALRQQVANHIIHMFAPRWQRAVAEIDLAKTGRAMYERTFTQRQRDLLDQLPSNWTTKADMHFRAQVGGGVSDLVLTVPCPEPVPHGVTGAPPFYRYGNFTVVKSTDEGMEHLEPIFEKLRTVHAERQTILDAVNKAMEPCQTVNQLVKVWPKALDYFPPEVAQKVNYRPARAKRERAAVVKREIDESVRATLLKAELLAK